MRMMEQIGSVRNLKQRLDWVEIWPLVKFIHKKSPTRIFFLAFPQSNDTLQIVNLCWLTREALSAHVYILRLVIAAETP